ncbi:MAG TPA: type II CRISPR RNA-guided endonuclease Cas9 [Beijerinckiaceae bacterium]|nr:type II CRISPR RNA-guided endonuclease Cas9 [Beijerinckiaceae bacterium]
MDPLQLRTTGLDAPLPLIHFGRALFHLNQRRGFKSNRRTDGKNAVSGAMAEGAQRLREAIQTNGARTLGEFLYKRQSEGSPSRFRQAAGATPGKVTYDLYPTRKIVEDEFDALWAAQAIHLPHVLTESARTAIRAAIFDQRPLRPVKPGRCTLVPEEERLPMALPSVQARVVFETLNALRFGEGLNLTQSLDLAQRKVLAQTLMAGKDLSFTLIRKTLKLGSTVRFSLEEGGRDRIEGSKTAKALSRDSGFGKAWQQMQVSKQEQIVRVLLEEDDSDAAVAWVMAETGLDETHAAYVSGVALPEGYGRLGATANALIVQELAADVITYDEAVRRAGEKSGLFQHHSDFRDGEIFPRLPYYARVIERHVGFGSADPDEKDEAKRFGRIANPTVHIGLNQLRRVTNRLIQRFGHPDEIVIELARDLKRSSRQRDEDQRRNTQNRKQNDIRRKKLGELGLPENGLNMALLRLYDEQMAGGVVRCPYTLRVIGVHELFTEAVEIEHVLPFSRTLDDGMANKVLCFREANRKKRNQTPFEAYGATPDWPAIAANAETLPPYKRWRFREDAMERFDNRERDMLARQLNETRHLARAAKAYLSKVCGDENDVWVVTGQLTALMRRQWGLDSILGDDNRKNRNDHRHHAIDAATIGCISRSMLQRVAREAARNEETGAARVVAGFGEPFPGFRDRLRDLVRTMIVSHKPEHGKGGALHEDTAYGIVKSERDKAIGNLVHRKPLDSLNPNEIERVRDPDLRAALQQVVHEVTGEGGKPDPKALSAALLAWAKADAERIAARTGKLRNPVRHVRLLKPKANAVPIRDRRTGRPYKAVVPDENWCLDVVSFRDGKGGQIWKAFAASLFEVNQRDWRPLWEREKLGGKLVMRLHKGDLLEIDDKDGVRRVKRVVRLNAAAERLYLVQHCEAGDFQKRHDDPEDPFRWDLAAISGLSVRNAEIVCVDEAGLRR